MHKYTIGRSRGCDIVLTEESISREHAEIVSQGGGEFKLVDSASTHGTFVEDDGVWVRVEVSALVGMDDLVMLGRFQTTVGNLLTQVADSSEETDERLDPEGSKGRRRLAAIVAMDIVGYSAKMGQDETRTLAIMRDVREGVVDPSLKSFGGRLFKEIGDGLLIEFSSANDAVMCCVDIQRRMLQRNAAQPEHRRMEFRIGVNVGDVIVQDDDVFGEGVNIAARLEPLADPGGICLSGVARELIKTKLDLGYKDLGEIRLKNIADPIRVFALGGDGDAGGKGKSKSWNRMKKILPI